MERQFSVLTFLSTEVQSIYIAAKLIRQTNAIISMEPYNYIWFIDRDEITEKTHRVVLSWCSLTIHI